MNHLKLIEDRLTHLGRSNEIKYLQEAFDIKPTSVYEISKLAQELELDEEALSNDQIVEASEMAKIHARIERATGIRTIVLTDLSIVSVGEAIDKLKNRTGSGLVVLVIDDA